MPIPAAILTQLADVLAEIYSDHTSARTLAITAGLRVERIAFDAKPVNYWAAVLEEAEAYGATQALLDRASAQYPNHTGLATVAQAYMAWRLPPLPPQDLPDKPYRYLDRYHRADAEIFFGRGREVRELVELITAADSPPIVPLYGQSGVGKSSLLEAGLQPRIEGRYVVYYLRRDHGQGLLGTITAGLGTAPGDDLATTWHHLETQNDKPLLVILDQVEEVYTRANTQQPDELADFLDALGVLFADAGRRPRGRLILSFRKEWLAEINRQLDDHRLPHGKGVFLERLGRAGIAEVVAGPQSSPRLRSHSGLSVTATLPGLIADDLLADRESPVAPMLAILLTDMWTAAKTLDYDHPQFDEDLYHEFRRRGLSLDDFLSRQLGALHGKLPEAVDSGLALDLLAHHTTPLGTAEQRTLAELEQTYGHCQDVLPALVQECRDLYLLVDPSRNQPDHPPASRLTHDTLAPHVRKRFDESDRPGQRARRILESRLSATGIDEAPGFRESPAPLGDADTNMVTMGQSGMRTWTPSEQELISASVTDRTRRVEEQRRIKQEREQARQRELEQAQKLAEKQSQSAIRLRLLVGILALLALVGPVWLIRQEILKNQARTPLIKVPEIQISTEMAREPLSVPEFDIEQFEVANWQYRLCVEAGVCAIPVDPMKFNDPNRADHPVVYVTAYQADQYCRWLGRRLPTSLEWERTVRGSGQKPWPWGSNPIDESRVNMKFEDGQIGSTSSVTGHPAGRTLDPANVFNLIGNVWEWTTTPFDGNPYGADPVWKGPLIERSGEVALLARGGSFEDYAVQASWAEETAPFPASRSEHYLGFRCMQDAR